MRTCRRASIWPTRRKVKVVLPSDSRQPTSIPPGLHNAEIVDPREQDGVLSSVVEQYRLVP